MYIEDMILTKQPAQCRNDVLSSKLSQISQQYTGARIVYFFRKNLSSMPYSIYCIKEVLRREIQGLKVYPVDRS